MRAVLQRVTRARVTVDDPSGDTETVGEIGAGLLAYVGVADGDGEDEARWLAMKIAQLRIFLDDEGRFARSLIDSGGAALIVSQFTLLADTRRGRRPSFTAAAPPEVAAPLVDLLADELRALGVGVEGGRFGAHMMVTSENDGPVTIMLDSDDRERSRRG
ncbi:MAG TPA: D-aminoacyl-tRNA deacylase [Dehalococcoidia bacterium]|nr:D-aminoacyl-tRNA deacylase [Dehalococcoidia bacterium]